MNTEDRHLIIGAGPVGLAFANALKARGIPYDQVDADNDLGGNWYHGVYESAHIISSKKTTQYADFPMPAHYPDFPSAQQMLEYLRDYAREFNLRDNIQFNTRVEHVAPREDERWDVTLSSDETRVYKGIIVANGHHWDCRYPEYPGTFTGEWMHSKQYREPAQLTGKRVLVIGGGNSACDIASEAARVGTASHWSMRRGHWFMPKTMLGVPTVELLKPWMPGWLQRSLLRIMLRIVVGQYKNYGLQRPDHRIFKTHPTISTEVLHYLKHGRITPHPAIAKLDGNYVEFVDGSRVEVDTIVCATGYHVSYPFLPDGLVEVNDAVPKVYAGGVHPTRKHLYVVGALQVRYGFGPLLTPYAELFADIIQLQDRLDIPIAKLLRRLGQRIPDTHLICPFEAQRAIRRGRRFLPLIHFLTRRLPFLARTSRAHGD